MGYRGMTAAAIINAVAYEYHQPIAAIETAAFLSAPHIVTSKATLCPRLAGKLRETIIERIKKSGLLDADRPADPVQGQ